MARRTAYLCIGLPGALGGPPGRPFAADLLAANADALAVAGHHVPAGPGETRRAAWEITRDSAALTGAGLTRADVEGTWDGIWRRAYRARPRNVVLAEDGFAAATAGQVALCLDALAGFRVHVVVLAADPADLLARAWTDAARRDAPMPLLRFRDRLEQRGPDHEQARRWWHSHHLGEVLQRWSAAVPAERVHVVVASGDDQARAQQAGLALGQLLRTRPLAPPDVAGSPDPVRRALPSTVLAAVRTEARRWAEELRDSAYDVHGDVGALVPGVPGPAGPIPAGLTATDRLHLTGDALADALAQLEDLRRENARLRHPTADVGDDRPRRRGRLGKLFV